MIKSHKLVFFTSETSSSNANNSNNNETEKKFYFISQYYQTDQTSILKTNNLKKKITEIANNYKDVKFSVYLKDLDHGPWLNYNSLTTFDGASLLKLPILITYLKAAETDPNILKSNIVYQEAFSGVDDNFDQTLKVGEKYNIEYLLKIMIQKSDNVAKDILELAETELNISPNSAETRELLGLYNEDNPNDITTDQYAGIFRILYNAEYLGPEMSNKALEILAQTEYQNGLRDSIPAEINISHKYGIRYYDDKKNYQLHDCGVIYVENPYSLCVMTFGQNQNEQEQLISAIAKASFETFH